jgi:MinD-like ATPase involved in chromosome partitioning or flagellar assembly
MSNDAKRVSQLGITAALANTDRVVVLTNPESSAQTQTISVNNFIKATSNNLLIANTSQRGVVQVDGVTINTAANGMLSVVGISNAAPETAISNGTPGFISYDSSYIYVCLANNNWKRVAISSWP